MGRTIAGFAILMAFAGCGAERSCPANTFVESNACVACPAGTTNEAGDDASGPDTMCEDGDACFLAFGVRCEVFDEGYIKASNTGAYDAFGYSVALSSDGSTLAVGAHLEDSAATGIGGDQASNAAHNGGAVYVFRRAGSMWSQEAYIKASNTGGGSGEPGTGDAFGLSVALSSDGSTLAVGAFQEGSAATGIGGDQASNAAENSGAVYVFRRAGSMWSQEAYIKASNTGADDNFGYSVALSSDGSTLAVGARAEDSAATGIGGDQTSDAAFDSGAVYMFRRTGSMWSQEAYIKASNTGDGDRFGRSVALSSDASTLAVGAFLEDSAATGIGGDQASNAADDSGAVYVFRRAGSMWSQEAYLKASNTGAGDEFGARVALSSDGSTLAVGARAESSEATGIGGDQTSDALGGSGAVYVFRRAGLMWSQEAYIKASNTDSGDGFAYSVALSSDGSTLTVGTIDEESTATGIGGDQTSNAADDSGAVYVFRRAGSMWSQEAYIKASNTGDGHRFGRSVTLSSDGSTLAVGADGEDSAATGIGGDQSSDAAFSSGAVYMRRIAP